ncbi:MAG: DUF1707 SHOCT-like domain-containing protein [Trebonia sp.]
MAEDMETRASDGERDDMVTQLQVAFADGRLDDAEFDARVRAALQARTRGDLDLLAADLPVHAPAGPAAGPTADTALATAGLRKPGRLSLAYKTSLRRGGRWRVPATFTAISYKGGTVIDLRAAELTSAVTTIRAIAYKTRVQVIAPPGIRVEISGIGVTSADEVDSAALVPVNAPVVHVRGLAYKGHVEIRSIPRLSPPAWPPGSCMAWGCAGRCLAGYQRRRLRRPVLQRRPAGGGR